MSAKFSLCVYCGSRPGLDAHYADAARAVGRWIGNQGGQLVFGGGRSGLMGVLAQAALEARARVLGIIPKALIEREGGFDDCTELRIVDTMHERKHLMAEHAHAFLALPGGIGTLEEFFEIWTWRQLGYHNKPIGLLNLQGYYEQLLGFLSHSVSEHFMIEWQVGLIQTDTQIKPLLSALARSAGFTPGP